eukprot:3009538-Rhodomonas_salina.4
MVIIIIEWHLNGIWDQFQTTERQWTPVSSLNDIGHNVQGQRASPTLPTSSKRIPKVTVGVSIPDRLTLL